MGALDVAAVSFVAGAFVATRAHALIDHFDRHPEDYGS